jgi:hypothetical protein
MSVGLFLRLSWIFLFYSHLLLLDNSLLFRFFRCMNIFVYKFGRGISRARLGSMAQCYLSSRWLTCQLCGTLEPLSYWSRP